MFCSRKYIFYIFAYNLIVTCDFVSSDDVPAILWNINGNAMNIKPVSAFGSNDEIMVESLKNVHGADSRIIVFAVNKLSLEDFSANDKLLRNNTLHNIESFLDSQPYMLLPTVKDPLNYIHNNAHCGVQEIVVDNKVDENIIKLLSSALQRSCVVILHISDGGVVAKQGELKSVFSPSFENSNKNIVGIFTGVKSSWGTSNNHHHVLRNLLQAEPETNFLNYTGCLIMYAENATMSRGNNNSISLPFPPTLEGSSCGNSSILQLNFRASEGSSVVIRLSFDQNGGSWTTSGNVSINGEEPIDLNTESIAAPLGYSYSCGDAVIKSKNSSFGVQIKMIGFQVQPFQVKDVFSDSFDCVPFFTIPIWMGIFVSLLLIIIAHIGIYALFSVHTMDRFDDPKGKTISVAASAD